ncbi:NocE [Clavibacter sp. VKM Ac-2873]|uniref:GDSL-type esterase/lipase family protein n=1 Tax=Clavibacter sp. VKM Ac-2873 TaxID=2783813 RepID=UPI00188C3158|nr:GDSL-type esterase/lipase family protein [Clavibacter sp. VKM Ac-2873]MBF4617386.1 NocE [Clavibacter sp. VKM Ac-2873]
MTTAGVVACGLLNGMTASAAPDVTSPPAPADRSSDVADDRSVVPEAERDRLLGEDWATTRDRATTAIGDQNGFTVYAADSSTGYEWAPVATLQAPGVETDRWIGNTCLTEDGSRMGVVYGTRAMTNDSTLFDAGAWGAIVDMSTGEVTQVGRGFSLAYFNPGCGSGNDVVMSAFTEDAQTRLVRIDAMDPTIETTTELGFEAASATPVDGDIVAAVSGSLIRITPEGTPTVLASASGVPYDITVAGSDVLYAERDGDKASVLRVPTAPSGEGTESDALATGAADDLGVQRDTSGHTYVLGETAVATAPLPPTTSLVKASISAQVSSAGQLLVEDTLNSTTSSQTVPDGASALTPVEVRATSRVTNEQLEFVLPPSGPTRVDAEEESDATIASKPTASNRAATQAVAGDPNNPAEAEATCAVARNDPSNQALQPKPRQVEWAVNQAVTGDLNKPRSSVFLARAGLNGSTPQGLFPKVQLSGGGRVPSQVMLGILAQESNLWQASRYTTPGVTGSPLIGNYYGNDVSSETFSWTADFAHADCGYGVSQVTDGMRKAGSERPGELALSPLKQRAIALDYGSNIAAGLQIISQKWNQTRAAGLVVNDGDPAYVENWFYAIWAYNSGFYPETDKAKNNGAWGVGWANNPANPKYKQNRTPFLEGRPSDAARPQEWPYPEKVLGFAAWSLELFEDATTAVPAFRPAWWTSTESRTAVKPPAVIFCVPSVNDCDPAKSVRPTAPGLSAEPSGPCTHTNADKLYDLKCWMHGPLKWKPDCPGQCGNELLRFSTGYAEQADGTAFAPNCAVRAPAAGSPQKRDTLPSDALVVDDTSVGPVRPCEKQTNNGNFQFTFGAGLGGYPSKIDTHQLGAGWNSHFWFAHTRVANSNSDLYGSLDVTGKWTLNKTLASKWTRVFVHLPDHAAWTQQAAYVIDLGDGTKKTRVIPQRTGANTWVSLGVFKMMGVPSVSLSNLTRDADGYDDVAWDAVAFQPLAAKPADIVVAMGDSFSSGEGSSESGGGSFYRETDIFGKHSSSTSNPPYSPDVINNRERNACHRSDKAWSRLAVVPGQTKSVGDLADTYSPSMDYHLIACSGALTQHVLPYYSVSENERESVRFRKSDQTGRLGKYREVSQLDSGFVDENTTLVTISIGGNDALFSDIVSACVGISACDKAKLEGDADLMPLATANRARDDVGPAVETVLNQIRKKAPNARILLMGYPALFSGPEVACILIRNDQQYWLREAPAQINSALALAAQHLNTSAGQRVVVFQDPFTYFNDHELCKTGAVGSYINNIRTDLSPGDDPIFGPFVFSSGVTSAQSIHPNALGQAAYAQAMSAALR